MYQTLLVEAVHDSGRQAVRFNIGSNAAILDVDDVDLLIERLGHIRSGLSPALPHEPSRTHNYVIEIDPCWYLDKNPLFDGVVLLLRHTGLGWQDLRFLNPAWSACRTLSSSQCKSPLK